MNGRELLKTSLGEYPLSNEPNASSSDDERRETWAAVIAGCQQPVVALPPKALGIGSASEFVAPEGWRPSVIALTPGGASPAGTKGIEGEALRAGDGETDELNRIQMRVNTTECGEVAVVVERAEAGLRVLIAAENPLAANTLHREASAMLRMLESQGHHIVSLKVVGMDQRGTELAKDGLTPRNERRGAKKANVSDSKSPGAEKAARRLLIIG